MNDADAASQPGYSRIRLAGIFLGPLTALLVLLTPAPVGLSEQGWSTAAVALWMAIWWMTEALPIAATALLPLVVFPLIGTRDIEQVGHAYAHPLIFLFLGGFLLARAMQVWALDHRLAVSVLRIAGSRPANVLAALMAVTAFLSMWVSNTATAMVMLPVAMSIASNLERHHNMVPALLLGVAYAATIGGMGTIVGTPPNALFVAFMSESYGIEISFVRWMVIAVPLVLVLLPLAWVVLTRLRFSFADSSVASSRVEIKELGTPRSPMSRTQIRVASLMLFVAAGWIARPLIESIAPWLALSDSGIALIGALLLFAVPADTPQRRSLLLWKEAAVIRWDVLILFGGGLALAAAISDSDLAGWAGDHLSGLDALPIFVLLLLLGALLVLVGELASNTAMAAVFLPIAGATAQSMGHPPYLLALPVALFATLGFMLPVATPPNAVVFGGGNLEMRHMLKAGAILDIAGIFIVSVAVTAFGMLALGSISSS